MGNDRGSQFRKGWMVSLSCPRTTRLFIKHQEMTAKRNEIRKVKGTKWRRNWVVTTSLLPYPSLFVILRWHKWLRSGALYYVCTLRVSLYLNGPYSLCFPFTFNFFSPFQPLFCPKTLWRVFILYKQVKRQVHDYTEENGDWSYSRESKDI